MPRSGADADCALFRAALDARFFGDNGRTTPTRTGPFRISKKPRLASQVNQKRHVPTPSARTKTQRAGKFQQKLRLEALPSIVSDFLVLRRAVLLRMDSRGISKIQFCCYQVPHILEHTHLFILIEHGPQRACTDQLECKAGPRSSHSSMCLGQSPRRSRDNARSARSLPPVWQRGQ